jgi:DNA-binding transcriptional LysR family regulator
MLSIHELTIFVEAAQTQNFSLAAHRLHLSQPAISLQVRHLELELGIELFRRNGRNVTLSEAGKVLLPLAQELLRSARHVEEVMWGLQGAVIGDLSIACSTTVGKYVLPHLIAGFRERHPDVQVAVSVMSRRAAVDWLMEGRAEIAVVSASISHREVEFQPFLHDQVILIVPRSHPWADGRSVSPQDLMEVPFIMDEPAAGAYEIMVEGLATHGLNVGDLRVVMQLGSAEAIEMSVEAGIGMAFVSRMVADRALQLGHVAEVPVTGMNLTRAIYLARQTRRSGTPPQQAFWDFACDPANEIVRRIPLAA